MPMYEIERYELHTSKYRVEANGEAEAIVKMLDGEADPMDDSLEYIEVADDFGIPVDENRDLADQVHELGVPIDEHVIPSIRSVEEVE